MWGRNRCPAGSIHTSDLTNWTSSKPVTALYLIEMYSPGDNSGEAALRQYAQALTAFLQRFSGTPQEADARAELERTNNAIARLTTPPPPTDPLAQPADATGSPATPASTPAGQQPAAGQPVAGTPPATPAAGTPPAKPVPTLTPEVALARAQAAWEQGDYAQADGSFDASCSRIPISPPRALSWTAC